jgi:deoxyribodipyrimidine photo-lyase
MPLLLWFRNDLRTHDNPALHFYLSHLKKGEIGRAVFFISTKQWREHNWSDIKIDFIKRHANALVNELATHNIHLELVNVDNFQQQISYLQHYYEKHNISEVVANNELEFNENQRDLSCLEKGINLTLFESDVIVPKGKILNKSDEMYKVFTPFKRAWLNYVKLQGFEYLGKPEQSFASKPLSINDSNVEKSFSSAWPLVKQFERDVLPSFLDSKLSLYHQQRDFPDVKATSGCSPYLAAGLLSPRYLLSQLIQLSPDILSAIDDPKFSWLNELIWREFYRHLIFHQPRLSKNQCFNLKYEGINWSNNRKLFNHWCNGTTGYPLVDAAMRQLNQTGWMHNRLRMVVASFLTKHLLIDWRWGEKYFMQQLIDGDLAANNGGWQWAASTGCDSQPYFRIFNPIRQSERFDPKGSFIRKYIPELENIPSKDIHFPHGFIDKNELDTYWPAIVEHKQARVKALAFYK